MSGLCFLQMNQDISATTPIQAEIGVWRYNEKRRTVHLSSYNKTVRTLAVTGKHTLKLLKVSGGMMPSLVRYDFILTDAEPSYEGVVRMQGMYTRRRGRGVLQECRCGKVLFDTISDVFHRYHLFQMVIRAMGRLMSSALQLAY
ncbi:MAG: hypothetical protein D3910_22220 [Candidatus Electrothrix sp. ATG2]|nr:hypothetical protein [Candidatus Electrothrix sp. ATG2]